MSEGPWTRYSPRENLEWALWSHWMGDTRWSHELLDTVCIQINYEDEKSNALKKQSKDETRA